MRQWTAFTILGMAQPLACAESSPRFEWQDSAAPASEPSADAATFDRGSFGALTVDAADEGALAVGAEASCDDLRDFAPVIVCFNDDAATYSKYLNGSAAAAVGRCPAATDFRPVLGESTCGYSACGPVPAGTVPPDAGAASCCFLVVGICGLR